VEDVISFLVGFGGSAAILIGSYASLKAIRHRWGRAPSGSELRDVRDRLEQLQQSMDTMAVEVERISEGQRFTTKLLAERAASVEAGER
jgi:hypothetical protein